MSPLHKKRVGIAIVGLGFWGKKLVRALRRFDDVEILGAYTLDYKPQERQAFPVHVPPQHSLRSLVGHPRVDAVAVATPASTHFAVAKMALEEGKHVFIEKPMALSLGDTHQLVRLAKEQQRILLVDHTYVYSAAVQSLQQYINAGALGDICAFESIRMNPGRFRRDCNVLWDLAVHDVAILHTLFGQPSYVQAQGLSHLDRGVVDTATLAIRYATGLMGRVHVSWLSAVKVRLFSIIGTKATALFDDSQKEKLILFEFRPSFRLKKSALPGPFDIKNTVSPVLSREEPLRRAWRDFLDCIRTGAKPVSGGEEGVAAVSVLTAAQRSLEKKLVWQRIRP